MATKKQIIANRRNAQKSTGPRTAEGKARVSQNALRHGLFARQLLLPDECPRTFGRFRNHFFAQIKPIGQIETFLAERLIATAWRLQRLLRIETEMITRDLDKNTSHGKLFSLFGAKNERTSLGAAFSRNLSETDNYSKLRRYESALEKSLFRLLNELRKLRSKPNSPNPRTSCHFTTYPYFPNSENGFVSSENNFADNFSRGKTSSSDYNHRQR